MTDRKYLTSDDNLLFSPDEIRHMRNERRRSKITKAVVVVCLAITTTGGVAYALHSVSSGAVQSRANIATTHDYTTSTQGKTVPSVNASATPPVISNQQAAPNQNSAPTPQGTSSSRPSLPVAPAVNQGCQVNSQALARINQIGAEQDRIATQEGHIGDEEAQGNIYDPSNGASYSSEITSLQQEAASLQQQENAAQAQLGCQ